MSNPTFHFQDGWFFSRLPDASVRIEQRNPPNAEGEIVTEIFIPPEAWASIVAQVSEGGETAGRWHTMLDFHGIG